MKNLLLPLALFLSVSSFAQSPYRNVVGIGGYAGWGSFNGFQVMPELNYGHFFNKNLEVGLQAYYRRKSDEPRAKLQKRYGNVPYIDQLPIRYSDYKIGLNAYTKYYLPGNKFRPFLYAEVGGERKGFAQTYDTGTNKFNNNFVNLGLGVGGLAYLNTKKNLGLEFLYKVNNDKLMSIPQAPQKFERLNHQFTIGLRWFFGN